MQINKETRAEVEITNPKEKQQMKNNLKRQEMQRSNKD